MKKIRTLTRRILACLLIALMTLCATLSFNAWRFPSRQLAVLPAVPVEIDTEGAVERFSSAVAIPTVSEETAARTDTAQFDRFRLFLEKSYPLVHEQLTRMTGEAIGDAGNQSLLFRWDGQPASERDPILLMAHYDVVPATEGRDAWLQDPFSGHIDGRFVWGRGTLDDKCGVIGLLEAVDLLLKQDFQPDRTIYLSFGHDEEIGGNRGNKQIAESMRRQGIRLEYVLDEGGGIFTDFPGVAAPVALVGVAEKGFLTTTIVAKVPETGHASMPPPETAIGILAAAIDRLQQHPSPTRPEGGIDLMLAYVGPEMPFLPRLAVANRWLFGSLVRNRLGSTPAGNAALRTTIAPTLIQGGSKDNVLPRQAQVTINARILPGETVDGTLDYIRSCIDDERIRVEAPSNSRNPSRISSIESPAFEQLHRTIKEIYPEVVVSPFVVVAGTDASHYDDHSLSRDVYRFTPWRLGNDQLKQIHGVNERMAKEHFADLIRFYVRLIRSTGLTGLAPSPGDVSVGGQPERKDTKTGDRQSPETGDPPSTSGG